MATEAQPDQQDRREVQRNDADVQRQQQGTTYQTFALADAAQPRGRLTEVSATQVVGSQPIPVYPQASHPFQRDPVPDEEPLGYRIDAMPELEPPIVASVFGEAQAPGPASDDAPSLASLDEAQRADTGPPSSDDGGPDDAA